MSFLEVCFTVFLAAGAVVYGWPQVVALVRRRTLEGLSVSALAISAVSNVVWTAYGIREGLAGVAIPSALMAVPVILAVLLCLQLGAEKRSLLPATVWALGLGGLAVFAPTAFHVVLGASVLFFAVPSLHRVFVHRGIPRAVSVPMWTIGLLDALVYLVYGTMKADSVTVIYGVLGTTVSLAMLLLVAEKVDRWSPVDNDAELTQSAPVRQPLLALHAL